MCCGSARSQRGVVDQCLKSVSVRLHGMLYRLTLRYHDRWINQRKAFGKPLSSQAVIRNKIAAMIARVESAQGWLENVTYQMNNMVRIWV